MRLQNHSRSRIWGFVPFLSGKASRTTLYIPSPFALRLSPWLSGATTPATTADECPSCFRADPAVLHAAVMPVTGQTSCMLVRNEPQVDVNFSGADGLQNPPLVHLFRVLMISKHKGVRGTEIRSALAPSMEREPDPVLQILPNSGKEHTTQTSTG